MKLPVIAIVAVVTSMLQICGSKDESGSTQSAAPPTPEPPNAAAARANASASLEAQIGGQLLTVGEHQVELKLFLNGYAEALVFDAKGKALAEPERAKVIAHCHAKGDAKKDVELGWQPPMARFAADGAADAELDPKPVDVELKLTGDKTAKGTLDGAVLLVGPELGGTLVVAGEHGIEVVADANGKVEALVHDRAGARVSGDAGAKLEVELSGADGKLHAVALAWNEASARFTGRVDAGVKLAAGPAKIGIAGKASVKLPKLALRGEAKHEGRVVVAGDFSVELVADGDVLVAYAFDASGAAHAKGDLDLSIKLGAGAFVKLAWDAPSLSYRAKISGELDLATQPIVVSLEADGKAHVGASFKAKGKLDANAEAKLDVPDVKGKVDLSSKAKAKAGVKANVSAPKIKVSPPKVSVKKSVSTGSGAKGKASAGFSIGTK
jgi:hypothetical protein